MKINISRILSTTYNFSLPSMRISIGNHQLFIKQFNNPNLAYAMVNGVLVQGQEYFSIDEHGNLWLELKELA